MMMTVFCYWKSHFRSLVSCALLLLLLNDFGHAQRVGQLSRRQANSISIGAAIENNVLPSEEDHYFNGGREASLQLDGKQGMARLRKRPRDASLDEQRRSLHYYRQPRNYFRNQQQPVVGHWYNGRPATRRNCRCLYPGERYRQAIKYSHERILPRTHHACQNIRYLCPGESAKGPIWKCPWNKVNKKSRSSSSSSRKWRPMHRSSSSSRGKGSRSRRKRIYSWSGKGSDSSYPSSSSSSKGSSRRFRHLVDESAKFQEDEFGMKENELDIANDVDNNRELFWNKWFEYRKRKTTRGMQKGMAMKGMGKGGKGGYKLPVKPNKKKVVYLPSYHYWCLQDKTSRPTPSPTRQIPVQPTPSPPTLLPTRAPSSQGPPSVQTNPPTTSPTTSPTSSPTVAATSLPTQSPTESPTASPTSSPTSSPTASPTESPSESPTETPVGSVNGLVFNDLNGNGERDIEEPGIESVSIVIVDSFGSIQTVTTDTNGEYEAQVRAGSIVTEIVDDTLPQGAVRTSGTDRTTLIVPTDGTAMDEDGFQFFGKVRGDVFEDENGNGIRDDGEPGIIINVIVTDRLGEEVILITDDDGFYEADVPAGLTVIDLIEGSLPIEAIQTAGTDPTTVRVPRGGTASDTDGFQFRTMSPSRSPTDMPSNRLTNSPTNDPTFSPTDEPTFAPSTSLAPDDRGPTTSPSPSLLPSDEPSESPSNGPSLSPSISPSDEPSRSMLPSQAPTESPVPTKSSKPSEMPSMSTAPSTSPAPTMSVMPSLVPTRTSVPTSSAVPSDEPSISMAPSEIPSESPTMIPSASPSFSPSESPSTRPSLGPSQDPSFSPTESPTIPGATVAPMSPSARPSGSPTVSPSETEPTFSPTDEPTAEEATDGPTLEPSIESATEAPTQETIPLVCENDDGIVERIDQCHSFFGAACEFCEFIELPASANTCEALNEWFCELNCCDVCRGLYEDALLCAEELNNLEGCSSVCTVPLDCDEDDDIGERIVECHEDNGDACELCEFVEPPDTADTCESLNEWFCDLNCCEECSDSYEAAYQCAEAIIEIEDCSRDCTPGSSLEPSGSPSSISSSFPSESSPTSTAMPSVEEATKEPSTTEPTNEPSTSTPSGFTSSIPSESSPTSTAMPSIEEPTNEPSTTEPTNEPSTTSPSGFTSSIPTETSPVATAVPSGEEPSMLPTRAEIAVPTRSPTASPTMMPSITSSPSSSPIGAPPISPSFSSAPTDPELVESQAPTVVAPVAPVAPVAFLTPVSSPLASGTFIPTGTEETVPLICDRGEVVSVDVSADIFECHLQNILSCGRCEFVPLPASAETCDELNEWYCELVCCDECISQYEDAYQCAEELNSVEDCSRDCEVSLS